ncbi:hypothetical protein GCM10023196_043850 [Actinoallomurus vinaceus]|uniref:Uncharacterized protein n=1 Tax=Actinoallomurus vinaceus TaxID=1080074 RepID=A0ABP8UDW1_9ACTN
MDRRVRTGAGVCWALLPFLTLGLATPAVFGYAAIHRRTARYWITAVAYLALFVVMLISSTTPEDSAAGDSVFTVVFLFAWFGGTVHAFLVRSQVFASPSTETFQDAIDLAEQRKDIRCQARRAAQDPAMAWELRIGRPDLPRRFDDGGLVDVNHVPPQVLASLPGMNGLVHDLPDRRCVREQGTGVVLRDVAEGVEAEFEVGHGEGSLVRARTPVPR